MASIFKTSLFPEQIKAIEEWKELAKETSYEPPIFKIKQIMTELSLNPEGFKELEEYARGSLNDMNKHEQIGCNNVVDIGLMIEALFKYPEEISKLLLQLISHPGWQAAIKCSMEKGDNLTNFDLLIMCVNMISNINDPAFISPLFAKFENLFEALASANVENLKPIVLCTLLLTVQEFKQDDNSKLEIFLRVHECCKKVYALDSFMITKQLFTKCYMYNRI